VNLFRASFRFILLALALGFLAPPVVAQVEVAVPTLPRVGVFIGGPLGGGVTEIVSADLRRTSMISPVGSGSGDYLATGEASDTGVAGRLVNKRSGAEVFSQTFSGRGRMAAHQFADAITQAVTGFPGFASSKLGFVAGSTRTQELYLADMDGFNAREITHDNTISASPSLNRGGTKIAYTSYKSGYPDVYVIDLGTGARTRIAFFPGINTGPAFSPDGSRLALTLSKDGNPEIYTMSVDGGSLTRITRTRGAETSPSWSPTGSQLVYSSDDPGEPQLFISSSSEVSEMDHLVTGYSYCTRPDWSADGKLIAFTTRVSGQFQIGIFDVAGRTAHLVTTAGGQDPAWTRDSRHLVYANNGHLHLLDTATGKSLPIDMNVGGCGEPTVSH
jgi:TolB protein